MGRLVGMFCVGRGRWEVVLDGMVGSFGDSGDGNVVVLLVFVVIHCFCVV